MNIGKRLLALRAAQNFSQGDIEHRAGLLRCYVSRVENGHTVPNLETLERWAKALKVEVYQLFFEGEGMPEPVPTSAMDTPDRREKELLGYFRQVDDHQNEKAHRFVLIVVCLRLKSGTSSATEDQCVLNSFWFQLVQHGLQLIEFASL